MTGYTGASIEILKNERQINIELSNAHFFNKGINNSRIIELKVKFYLTVFIELDYLREDKEELNLIINAHRIPGDYTIESVEGNFTVEEDGIMRITLEETEK